MEIWKQIPSAPCYEVSNLGRVRRGNRILHIRPHSRGYRLTTLGTGKPSVYIHHIVAEAFIGPRPAGAEIDHIDFDRANNRLDNLQYLSVSGNRKKTWDSGRGYVPTTAQKVRGEQQWCHKLTADDVRHIRLWAEIGFHKTDIAKQFGIKVRQVFKIITRQQWKHV